MLPIGAFLLYALIATTSAAPPKFNISAIPVFVDVTGCVNLKCHIEGAGGNCNFQLKPLFQMPLEILRKNESEAAFLKRVERKYPFNTFTIIKYPGSNEVCNEYALVCNSLVMITYKQFIDYLKDPEAPFKPKLVCSDKDKPAFSLMKDD